MDYDFIIKKHLWDLKNIPDYSIKSEDSSINSGKNNYNSLEDAH